MVTRATIVAGRLGVDPAHGDRRQPGPEVEADQEAAVGQHLDDRSQPEPLDGRQRHHDHDHQVDQVHGDGRVVRRSLSDRGSEGPTPPANGRRPLLTERHHRPIRGRRDKISGAIERSVPGSDDGIGTRSERVHRERPDTALRGRPSASAPAINPLGVEPASCGCSRRDRHRRHRGPLSPGTEDSTRWLPDRPLHGAGCAASDRGTVMAPGKTVSRSMLHRLGLVTSLLFVMSATGACGTSTSPSGPPSGATVANGSPWFGALTPVTLPAPVNALDRVGLRDRRLLGRRIHGGGSRCVKWCGNDHHRGWRSPVDHPGHPRYGRLPVRNRLQRRPALRGGRSGRPDVRWSVGDHRHHATVATWTSSLMPPGISDVTAVPVATDRECLAMGISGHLSGPGVGIGGIEWTQCRAPAVEHHRRQRHLLFERPDLLGHRAHLLSRWGIRGGRIHHRRGTDVDHGHHSDRRRIPHRCVLPGGPVPDRGALPLRHRRRPDQHTGGAGHSVDSTPRRRRTRPAPTADHRPGGRSRRDRCTVVGTTARALALSDRSRTHPHLDQWRRHLDEPDRWSPPLLPSRTCPDRPATRARRWAARCPPPPRPGWRSSPDRPIIRGKDRRWSAHRNPSRR